MGMINATQSSRLALPLMHSKRSRRVARTALGSKAMSNTEV